MQNDSSTPVKTCTRCGVEKPATTEFFYPHPECRLGLRPDCLECAAKQHARYYQKHGDEYRMKQRERSRLQGVRPLVEYNALRARRIDEGVKLRCSKCGEEKPATLEFFARARNNHLDSRCRVCVRTAVRSRYDPERARREQLRYVERRHRYYLDHRDEILERSRDWRLANSGRKKETRRVHYAAHREEYIARALKWQAANKDSRRATSNRRRSARGSHTAADIASQLARQHGRCYWCGGKVGDEYHADHVVPLALGGSNDPGNIVVSCPPCNLSKSAKHPMDWAGRMF